jgi:hypothetical protein
MSGKKRQLSPLESRKSLLVAESELNRAQFIEDWQTMGDGVHSLAARVKSVSSLAAAAALLGATLLALRRGRASTHRGKSSWLQMAIKGAKVVGSIFLALRPRPRN